MDDHRAAVTTGGTRGGGLTWITASRGSHGTVQTDGPMNDVPKVVFSRTLTMADWPQSTIASGDLADEISALKRQPART